MAANTDIQVVRFYRVEKEGSSLKAFADLCIGESLIVKGFKVVEGEKGLFVGMPRVAGKDGKWYNTVYPATKQKRQEISEVILSTYRE